MNFVDNKIQELIDHTKHSVNLVLSYEQINNAYSKLIRCGTIDNPNCKDGWLQIFSNSDGSQIANFGNFKTGVINSVCISKSIKYLSLNIVEADCPKS